MARKERINMITKAVLVSAAATGLFLAQPQNANAGTSVDVDVGVTVNPV